MADSAAQNATSGLSAEEPAGAEGTRRGRRLRQERRAFETVAELLPDWIARFDRELRFLYASPAIEAATGLSARELAGRTSREAGLPPELCDPWDDALGRVFSTGQPERLDLTMPPMLVEGTRHFDARLVGEPPSERHPTTVLSVARDVTELRLSEAAHRHASATADALRAATVVLTCSLDPQTVLVTLLDHLHRLVPFDRARILVVEDAVSVTVRAHFDGERVVPLPIGGRPRFKAANYPIVQKILKTGTSVLIPNIHTLVNRRLPIAPPAGASWMGVPLFARGRVSGLLSLSNREAGFFTEEHVKLAEAMASHAAIAAENAVLFEQMQGSHRRMRSLSRRLVELQESERRHIARELHDEAGQSLASLRFGLRVLEREAEEGRRVTARVADLMKQTDAVMDGLHRLAADLRPASLDPLGLAAALRQYSRSAAAKFGLEIHFKARGFSGQRLPPAVETALYRVVQEAMTNVVRHARATRVDIFLEHRGDRVMVMVEDDGVGFDPDRARRGERLGLLGLLERAEALGGTLTIESAPRAGTTILVEVPSADPHSDRR